MNAVLDYLWNLRLVACVLVALLSLKLLRPLRSRTVLVPWKKERVLVLGASSGVGRAVARVYARRGARVCVVARRRGMVDEVVEELRWREKTRAEVEGEVRVLGVQGDFGEVGDMERVKTMLVQQWGGVDTVIVAAGVSALQPLMSLVSNQGVQTTVDVAAAAIKGNFTGPLISAITFIPLLESSSRSPSLLLLSSLAALIPAPTRSLYGSSKAASLLLYQSLSIEHPKIKFTLIIPSTIQGSFRQGAVDAAYGPLHEDDPNAKKGKGLAVASVAERCVRAVDESERMVFMPGWMCFAQWVFWIWPGFVERKARKKYNYIVT